jgi:hypothetical protein
VPPARGINVSARIFVLAVCLLGLAPHAGADDKSELLAKQKTAAEQKWKKLGLEKTNAPIETPNFFVYAHLAEAKTKALGSVLDKQFVTALKGLKYDAEERPWQGKLALFVFPERSEFVDFLRKIEKRSPEEDEASFFSFGDEPALVIGTAKGTKADPSEQAKYELAGALLKRRMGAGEPPEWVTLGFVKATEFRAANPGVKGKNNAWRTPNAPLAEIWGENLAPAAKQAFAASVIDYLAYGPLSEQFPDFLAAFRPDENGTAGTVDAALKAINLDDTSLVLYARTWIRPKATKPKK